MSDAYFVALRDTPDAGRYVSSAHVTGPWDSRLAHGGPPSALLVRAAERLAASAAGRRDLIAMRVAAEFVGPVPVGEVSTSARIVRVARTAVLVHASLAAAGRACLEARVWLVRDADTSAVAHATRTVPEPSAALPGIGGTFPYAESIDWRSESGSLRERGPGTVWARPKHALVDGEPLSGLARVCLVGDSASGISSELDWDSWSFLNVDLDVHLSRPVAGEWVRIDAATRLGAHGSALARSTVSDTLGDVGCTAQTLILAPRPVSAAG